MGLLSALTNAGVRIAFLIGLIVGGGAIWYIQYLRINLVQEQYDNIVEQVKLEAEIAHKHADNQVRIAQLDKQASDDKYKASIDNLHADIERLQHARASRGFVPANTAPSTSPSVACFDRAELERALQRLDTGVQGLLTEGDEAAIGLNNARSWGLSLSNLGK